jgi:hypothetical protein
MSKELLCAEVLTSEVSLPEDVLKSITEIVKVIDEKAVAWKELAAIEVKDHKDLEGIKVAKRYRLQIKNERLEAQKFLASKRAEVQEKMQVFTNTDKAYLKLTQYYEKVAKGFEETLSEKETLLEQYEAQQKAMLREKRLAKLSEVTEDSNMYPVETMTEEAFNNMYQGFKLAKEKAEELERQRLEEEEARLLKQKLEAEAAAAAEQVFKQRELELAPYTSVEYQGKGLLTVNTTEEQYTSMVESAKAAFITKEKELEELRIQKAEEEKARQKEEAFKKAIAARHSKLFSYGMRSNGVEFSFNDESVTPISIASIETMSGEEFTAAYTKADEQIKAVVAKREAEQEALRKQQEEARKAEEARLEAIRIEQEKIAQQKAAEEAKLKLGDKEFLSEWAKSFSLPACNKEIENKDLDLVRQEIISKFEGFKSWAAAQINKA